MSPEAHIYRSAIIRAVNGRSGVPRTEHDSAALDDICERLAQAELSVATLRRLGYGSAGMLPDEIAATVPMKI